MSPDKQALDDLRIDRGAAPTRPPYGLVALVLFLLVAAAGGAWWWFNRPQTAEVRTIVVASPASGGAQTLLNASGYVTARREATVSSKVTGKVVEVLVEEGMKVKEGQILARLDATNLEKSLALTTARLESTRKSLEETRANLEQAQRELKRASELAAQQIASQAELDRAGADVKALRARLDRQQADVTVAERELALSEQQLDDTVIRAPFGGVVTSKNAQPGEMISPVSAGGGFTRTGICTIVDMDSLEIEVDVNESYINRVVPDQPVEATLDSYPDWRIPAKVIAIIPTADRQKATVQVRVGFEEIDARVLPHMAVKVAFQRAEADEQEPVRAVSVPKTAVRQREGRDMVWLVRDGRLERRAITVSDKLGEQVTVTGGLNGGERVVIEGPENLAEGARVVEKKR
jgi:HlyD family secretion protein